MLSNNELWMSRCNSGSGSARLISVRKLARIIIKTTEAVDDRARTQANLSYRSRAFAATSLFFSKLQTNIERSRNIRASLG